MRVKVLVNDKLILGDEILSEIYGNDETALAQAIADETELYNLDKTERTFDTPEEFYQFLLNLQKLVEAADGEWKLTYDKENKLATVECN